MDKEITYEEDIDAAYIPLAKGNFSNTLDFEVEGVLVNVDVDDNGLPIGIEIIGVKDILAKGKPFLP